MYGSLEDDVKTQILLQENGTSAETVATISPISFYPQYDITSKTDQKVHTPAPSQEPHTPHQDDEGRCGWLSFRPNFLQKFRTSKWVLFGLIWAAATQGNSL